MSTIYRIANPERVRASQETRRSNAAGCHRDTVPKNRIKTQEISDSLHGSEFPPEMFRNTQM